MFEEDFIFKDIAFEEALRYFQSKIPLTERDFYRLAREARARAFTVSTEAGLDAIKEIKDSLTKAIQMGQTLAEWKKSIKDSLAQWGIDGWRAETIYRTNLQTAYQVGRYEQMTDPDLLEARPYWMYVAVMDAQTRPEHAALHGKVFPANDPFWDHWYPPNGFNCRCRVISLSPEEVKRDKIKIEKGSDWHNRPIKLPDGTVTQLIPDPGWDGNPGKEGLARI